MKDKNPQNKVALIRKEISVTKDIESEKRIFRKEPAEESINIPIDLFEEDVEIKRVAFNKEVSACPGIRLIDCFGYKKSSIGG